MGVEARVHFVDDKTMNRRPWGHIYEAKKNSNRPNSASIVVRKCGFVVHSNIGWIGASPDRIEYDPNA